MNMLLLPADPRGSRQRPCKGTCNDATIVSEERHCSDDDLLADGDLLGWKLMDPTPGEAKLLGVTGDYQTQNIDHDDVTVLTSISKEGALNARQAMEAAKGAFSVGASPAFPPDVELVTCLPSNARARVQEGEQPEQDLKAVRRGIHRPV